MHDRCKILQLSENVLSEKIFEKTLNGVRKLSYPQDKIKLFVADDTPENDLSEKYKKITTKYDGEYIYYPKNKKYKAGMLNLAIPHSHSKFIAFFDFDQIPQPDIMTHMIGLLELAAAIVPTICPMATRTLCMVCSF